MKRFLIHAVCFLLVTAVGCSKSSNTGGEGKETFTISAPGTSTSVASGNSKSITLSIKPSSQFHQKVKLEAKPLQTGVKPTLEQKEVTLDGHNRDVNLMVSADDDAAPGKYDVRVTATPEKGKATSVDVEVKVKQKSAEQLSVSAPLLGTNVRRGESRTVDITLKPSSDFNQTVKLSAKSREDGITAKFDQSSVKLNGENRTVKLTVTAGKDASTGNRTVTVTATPERGEVQSAEVKFTVKE
jgi:uncharacterized membrane protein